MYYPCINSGQITGDLVHNNYEVSLPNMTVQVPEDEFHLQNRIGTEIL